jgi:hypothetical protein
MHALAAWVTGGAVASMAVHAGEGMTWTSGGFFPLISAAGYVGTALWGTFLLMVSSAGRIRTSAIIVSLSLPVIAMLIAGGVGVNWLVLLVLSITIYPYWTRHPLAGNLVMSSLFASESWRDVQVYLFAAPDRTDAGILARHWGSSGLTLFIALAFALFSATVWCYVLQRVLSINKIKGRSIKSTFTFKKDAL